MSRLHRALLLALVLLLAGCGGLSPEPPIVQTFAPVTRTVDLPTTPPDLAVGASVFAEHCTKCHGLSGAGDGELIGNQQGQIANRPPSFRGAATTADQTPLTWYETITNGDLAKSMPPWANELSADERWAVALYTYTLHNTKTNVDAGQALTAANPVTPANLPTLQDSVKLTDAELITQAGLPAAFINSLSTDQKNDLAAYLRSLLVANPQHMGLVTTAPQTTEEPATTPQVTPEVTPEVVGTGTITGQITNGTSGAALPSDLKVNLYIVSANGANEPIEANVGADGKFSYANINIIPTQKYVVTTKYKGRAFGSEAKDGDATTNTVALPITIYETTSDASVLTMSFWVTQIQVVGTTLEVSDFILFNNSSDKAYSTDMMVDDQRYTGVTIPVPNNAEILSANVSNPRYTISADGHSIIDTASVLPGDGYNFQMVYRLPYQGNTQIEQPIPYRVGSTFRILLDAPTVTTTSETLKVLDPKELNGVMYQVYGLPPNFTVGDSIRYSVQGGSQSSATSASFINANQLIPMLLVVVGLIAIITAAVLYWRDRPKPALQTASSANDTLVNGLIQQIAELDNTYNAGSLDEVTYQKRRDRLKARLAALLDEEK